MLSKTLNDLPALQQFFDNVFPQLSAIILVEGTDLSVSKKVCYLLRTKKVKTMLAF